MGEKGKGAETWPRDFMRAMQRILMERLKLKEPYVWGYIDSEHGGQDKCLHATMEQMRR